MATIDILMLIPLAWGGYNGYRKGIIVEIVGVVAFILAMIVGLKFIRFGSDLLAPYLSTEITRRIVPYLGFSIIFFPTIFLVNRLGYSLKNTIKYTLFGTFDSFLGAVVGVFTWVFGISVLFWLLSTVNIQIPPKHAQGSLFMPIVSPIAPQIISVISDWIPVGGNMIREWKNSN